MITKSIGISVIASFVFIAVSIGTAHAAPQSQGNGGGRIAAAISNFFTASTTNPGIVLTSARTPEVWARGSNHAVTWNASSTLTGVVRAYLVPIVADASGKQKNIELTSSVDAKKGTAPVKTKALENATLNAKYKIRLEYTYGRTEAHAMANRATFALVSSSTIQIGQHATPFITITSPSTATTTQWKVGSTHNITWIANFVKGHSNDDETYKDVRVVPTYGIDPSQKSLDASKLSPADRTLLASLAPNDLLAVSQLPIEKLEILDPTKILAIPGLSVPGQEILKKLSPAGLSSLPGINLLGLPDLNPLTLALKPIELLTEIDPLSKAIFGGLFGSGDVNAVKATIYFVPLSTGTTASSSADIKIKNVYVESAKQKISLKDIKPGQYLVKIVAKLKNTTITATSTPFTVVK